MTAVRILRRLLLVFVLAALVVVLVGAAWALTHRDQVRAWRQAAVIGANLADDELPVPAAAVGWLGTDARAVRPGPTDGSVYSTTVVEPAEAGPHPAIALLVPARASDADRRQVLDAQDAIAAAGIAAWSVSLPTDPLLLADLDAGDRLGRTLRSIALDPRTRGGDVSVVATGAGASLVLRQAAVDRDATVRSIVAVQPIADVRSLLRRALVDPTTDVEVRRQVGQALALAARAQVDPGATIARSLLQGAATADDPIAQLRSVPAAALPGSIAELAEVVRAGDAVAFDAAWQQLDPAVRTAVEHASPLAVAGDVDQRVLLVADPADVITSAEARRLQRRLPDVRRVDVGAGSIDQLDAGELLSVSAWWLQQAGA